MRTVWSSVIVPGLRRRRSRSISQARIDHQTGARSGQHGQHLLERHAYHVGDHDPSLIESRCEGDGAGSSYSSWRFHQP